MRGKLAKAHCLFALFEDSRFEPNSTHLEIYIAKCGASALSSRPSRPQLSPGMLLVHLRWAGTVSGGRISISVSTRF